MGTTSTVTPPGLTKVEEVQRHELTGCEVHAIAQGRDGNVYVALAPRPGQPIRGEVFITERADGLTYIKPVTEAMGPVHDRCPAKVLDVLDALAPLPAPTDGEPSGVASARLWRARCRANLAARAGFAGVPNGATIRFARPAWGDHYGDTFEVVRTGRKVRFRTPDGHLIRLGSYTTIGFDIIDVPS